MLPVGGNDETVVVVGVRLCAGDENGSSEEQIEA